MEKYSVNMEKSPSKTGTGCAKPDYFHKKERKYGEKCVFIPENGSINFKGADLCFSSRTMKKGNGNPLEGVAQMDAGVKSRISTITLPSGSSWPANSGSTSWQ